MREYIWLNGETLPLEDAKISVEDRGYQFADGVYEVIRIYNNRPFTLREHLRRLERSCADIEIRHAFDRDKLAGEITRFIERDNLPDGMVYLQVTRGVAPRNHIFPDRIEPTILFYTRPLPPMDAPGEAPGVKLHSVPDERWRRCWIKAIALLPNVLAKNAAVAQGADEAVFIENGIVSECSASNFFAVIDGQLITHPIGPKVLPGITRLALTELAIHAGVPFVERPIYQDDAASADELFITSTTRELSWVKSWDGHRIADHCGPVTRRLHEALAEKIAHDTGYQRATSSDRRDLVPSLP
jgi:D-alanine transaminase